MIKSNLLSNPLWIVSILLLASCTFNPQLPDVTVPEPLIEPINAKVAVIFDDDFRNYNYETEVRDTYAEGGFTYKYKTHVGEYNVNLFRELSQKAFVEIDFFDSIEDINETNQKYDGVMHPKLLNFQYHLFKPSALPYKDIPLTTEVRYQIELLTQDGGKILEWTLNSRESICGGELICSNGNDRIFEITFRDIIAKFLANFFTFPEIIKWQETL